MSKESDRLREQAAKAARHAAATTDERTSKALRDMEREYRAEADRMDASHREALSISAKPGKPPH
jgi:hypothetical protein